MAGSILETFYILFKTDAKDVEDGAGKAEKAVDDLESSIGGADKETTLLGKKFNQLATTAVAAFGSIFAVTQLMSSAKAIAGQSQDLNTLGKILGESTAELTNWGRAVETMGGTTEGFRGSVRGLAGSLNDTLINGVNGATIALSRMGISVHDSEGNMKSVLTILPEIAKGMEGMNREAALAFGSGLGLDEGTILLLMQGEGAVRGLVGRQREMNRVTADDTARLAELNVQVKEFSNLVGDISTGALLDVLDIYQGFAPALVEARGEWETIDAIVTHFSGRLDRAEEILNGLAELSKVFGEGLDIILGSEGAKDADKIAGEALGTGQFGESLFNATPFGKIVKLMGEAFDDLVAATAIPVSAIGAAGANGGGTSRSSSVSVGEITIETQATDAAGIGKAISGELGTQLQNAIDENDDGVAG